MAEICRLGCWHQNAKTRFSGKLSDLLSCNWGFQSTHYWTPTIQEICYVENRNDVIFFCRWWSSLDTISETGAEWHVNCGDVVKIENRCRIPIWQTFGRTQWHAIPEPRITLQGAATWWIHCHDSRATWHIAGCSNMAKSCHDRAALQRVRIASAILNIVFRHIFFVFNEV